MFARRTFACMNLTWNFRLNARRNMRGFSAETSWPAKGKSFRSAETASCIRLSRNSRCGSCSAMRRRFAPGARGARNTRCAFWNIEWRSKDGLLLIPPVHFRPDANRYPDLEILTHEFKHVVDLPLLQNLVYIYGLNEFRKLDWALRAIRGKDWCWPYLKGKLDTWIIANDSLLTARLKNMQERLDFMENENTLGQHRYSNIPLLKEVYDEYLSKILKP